MNIFQRINEVRKEVSYVKKDATVREGGGYQAVTHDAVTSMLRDSLIKNGVVITASLQSSSIGETGTTSAKGVPFIRYMATYEVCFVNAETPEDKHCINVESHALDLGDKAPGKSMSYAKKYAMLKTFEIETGEDDEGRHEQKADKNANGIKNANGTITPNDGAIQNASEQELAEATIGSQYIIEAASEERWEDALTQYLYMRDTYSKEHGPAAFLAMWEMLKPHSKIRNTLKKMNNERKAA